MSNHHYYIDSYWHKKAVGKHDNNKLTFCSRKLKIKLEPVVPLINFKISPSFLEESAFKFNLYALFNDILFILN